MEKDNEDLIIFEETIKQVDGEIFVKPLTDFFGIDYPNQVERINRDKILKNQFGKNRFKSVFGDNIPRVTLSRKGFVRWIQILNPALVRVELREKFIDYQERVFDYLYANSVEKDDQAATNYRRLVKLRRLYSLIGNEIQKVDREFKTYLEGKYILNFNRKYIK